ncbi:hypothetical protein K474DRAFT_1655406 [Panus rudis PR-1116 ss-1]|nr:hypothetical protein K474DRAFT_1655406 [Panus rudis PR-1116 ss-1]
MDVIQTVQDCISTWDNGGAEKCRAAVTTPHSNPSDPDAYDFLTTVYHVLFTATLRSWKPKASLAADQIVDFIQTIQESLPSTSGSTRSSHATIFGVLLVDVLWSLDSGLEEIVLDHKVAEMSAEQGTLSSVAEGQDGASGQGRSTVLERATQAKEVALADREMLSSIVRKLLVAKVLDPDLCRERLDIPLIASAGLIVDQAAFEKKEIRTRTALFYKQNKLNLLREQSEGYSKLTAEITSSLGPPHSPATGLPVESEDTINDRARPSWERVLGLIGYFDLDPNRALDVILDIFSAHLTTHWQFFLAFLSFSPWSSSVLRRRSVEAMSAEPDPNQYRGKSLDEVLQLAEAQAGYISPPSPFSAKGSNARVLAQVLGFKFSHYQNAGISEPTPRNLYLMVALLIREGFISLEDLYPHLSPNEAGMDDLHKKYLDSVETRISNAKISQLALAAPLESSNSASKSRAATQTETKKTPEPAEVPNQKLGLLHALFSIGALRPAIGFLSRFPWFVDAYPEIADLVIRILKHSITPLYESNLAPKTKATSFTQPRARYGGLGVVSPPERKPQLTLWAPTPPSTSTIDYVFFYPGWSNHVPMAQTLDDLVDVIEPFMRFIGLHVSRDPTFLTKFLRLGRMHLMTTITIDPETKRQVGTPDPENPIRRFWYKALRLYLLPALPLIRGNAVCTVEVWNIMRQYETTLRWKLYGEWKDSTYRSHPELRVRFVQADRESKGILRRLSHNTIDSLSGNVAKLAHSNPCIFFANAVHQIMAYDNLAGVVIQALNFVTIMGFDVLLFIVLDALANPHKARVKDDGVNTSDWLQSLASFTGMLFRRYSADLTPLLTYIVHQLYNGQTTEIIVLRELIWKMVGIEPLPSLSESQIAAMSGGPALRIEAIASSTRGARLDPGDALLKGPYRLGKALLESSLALPLLIQVAQQRQSCVYQAATDHLKPLASLFDTTHGVLLQYLELLTSPSVISLKDYEEKIVPSLTELNLTYGISAPICMQIIRPILNAALLTAASELQEKERIASEETEKRLKAALAAKREPSAASRVASPAVGETATPTEAAADGKVIATENGTSTEPAPMEGIDAQAPANAPAPESPWLPQLAALFDDIRKIAPGDAADVLGPGFYLSFWQLSTYELSPPTSRYEEELTNLRELSKQENSRCSFADRSPDRATRLSAMHHRDKRDRINAVVEKLLEEMKDQTAVRAFTIKRLAREKQYWFAHGPSGHTLASSFIQHCLQPRCLLSPMDADYCAQIIKVIHLQGTPGFSTLKCYDKVLSDHIKVVVFSCSEYEARNYGRFLLGILTDLWKWFQDEQLYLQDNRTKSGGKYTYLPGFVFKWPPRPVISLEDLMTWSDFKRLIKKWHMKLGKCLLDCIETGEFMHVYNAIIVLKEILPVFPVAAVTEYMGSKLDIAMQRFLEKEERGDLKILGRAYAASLKKREPSWAKPKAPAPAPSTPKPVPSAPAAQARTNGLPFTPNAPTEPAEHRRAAATAAPIAPRAQLAANGVGLSANDRQGILASVPRPEVVKRIRPDTRTPDGTKAPVGSVPKSDAMDVDPPSKPQEALKVPSAPSAALRPNASLPSHPSLPKEVAMLRETSRPSSPISSSSPRGPSAPQSPRTNGEDGRAPRQETTQNMPPPTIPSQTASAQELRETARQSRQTTEKEDKQPRSTLDGRNGTTATAPSPTSRRRSPSPTSRPGTRNASADSRTSGGRTRESTRNSGDGDDRRPDRESRQDSSRRDGHSRGERSGRAGRESDREKESDRERDRRDRHGDRDRRERDRDRDREKDRDRETRDRDRDRERDRDRDRDRDRHRRDDKDRDRERKEREARGAPTAPSSTNTPDERGLPSRPDTSRHRAVSHADDSLGKRRRPTDEDPDRTSKRTSRKDGHHEERSRRSSEKEGHDRPRDSERRRGKDREVPEADHRPSPIDTKGFDKRAGGESSAVRLLPSNVPSAPRAMSSGDLAKGIKSDPSGRDREWRQRDQGPRSPGGLALNSPAALPSSEATGSLRSRIGDKDLSRPLPQAPLSHRAESSSHAERTKIDGGPKDDDRDSGRKRTASERERDVTDPNRNAADNGGTQPAKRVRLNRNRYSATTSGANHGVAKKLLPIDNEKRSGRKD